MADATETPGGHGREGLWARTQAVINEHIVKFMLWPGLLVLAGVFLYPVIEMVRVSFFQLVAGQQIFVGLENYNDVLSDSQYYSSFVTTLKYSFGSVIMSTVGGMVVALAVQKVSNERTRNVYIALILTAWAVPLAVAAFMWRWVLAGQYGLVNSILRAQLGMSGIGFLTDDTIAMFTVTYVDAWVRMPFAMIILFAGLQSIPEHMYDAAEVDGATTFQTFWHVTIPYLRPSLFVATLINWMFAWRAFAIAFPLTGGGPGTTTKVLSILIYQNGMELFDFGYTNAVSVTLVLVTMIVGAFYVKFLLTSVEE